MPPEAIEAYRPHVPAMLVDLWESVGIGSWKSGRLRICNPIEYRDVLEMVFASDADLSIEDCHVYATSVFGTLYFWSERHFSGTIDLIDGRVICSGLTSPEEKGDPEVDFLLSLFDPDKDTLDWFDDEQKPLYGRAVKEHGRPGRDDCFGFVPAIALGGDPNLENVRKYPALAHFGFLAQAQTFLLYDYLSRPIRQVRPIG